MRSFKVVLWFCLTLHVHAVRIFRREFIKRELNGRLIKLEDIHHGQFFLYIADVKTKDTDFRARAGQQIKNTILLEVKKLY